MSKIDLDTISSTSIVKLTSSEATAYVKGDKLIDDNQTLSTAIRNASLELSKGESNVEYVIIAVERDDVPEGTEAT